MYYECDTTLKTTEGDVHFYSFYPWQFKASTIPVAVEEVNYLSDYFQSSGENVSWYVFQICVFPVYRMPN